MPESLAAGAPVGSLGQTASARSDRLPSPRSDGRPRLAWTPSSGATATSYTLTGSDTGNRIRITVTETNTYGSASGSSLGTQPILSGAPVNTAHATVSGTVNQIAYQGATLTGAVDTWSPTGTFSYKWEDSSDGGTTWTAIPGATSLTYVVAPSDVGKRIRITVTATNTHGSASGSSLGAAVSS